MESTVITKSIISGATKRKRNERLYGLSCALRLRRGRWRTDQRRNVCHAGCSGAADGVRHLFATSHSTPGMERFPQEVYDRHLALARAYCTQKGYDLKLEHGSELLYTPAAGYAAGLRAAVQPYGRNYGTKIDRNGRHGISCITAFAVSNKNRLRHLFRSVVLRTNCTEEVLFRN